MNEARSFRENAALARRYDTPNDPVQTIASDAFPIIGISDELIDPELHFLRGSRLCAGTVVDQAVVGSNSMVLLRNPPGSTTIAVARRVDLIAGAAISTVFLGILAADTTPDSEVPGIILDPRASDPTANAGRSTCRLGDRTVVAATVSEEFARYDIRNTLAPLSIDLRVVLVPGSSLWAVAVDLNTQIRANFWWRERRLELAETRDA